MEATMQASTTPLDALWTLFLNQTKKVQREFSERIVQYNNAAVVTPELAQKIANVEKARVKGETIAFDSAKDLDAYLESHEL